MSGAVTIIAAIGAAATAVIYGTDLFCALVLCPAANRASARSVVELIGPVHHYGDRRLPPAGIAAIVAAATVTALAATPTSRAGAAIALVALLAWLAVYRHVSAPINKRLRAAAATHTIPDDTRRLQQRWQSVIWYRATLQTIALTGLLTSIIAR